MARNNLGISSFKEMMFNGLKTIRYCRGYTQQSFAAKIHTTVGIVHKSDDLQRRLDVAEYIYICAILRIDVAKCFNLLCDGREIVFTENIALPSTSDINPETGLRYKTSELAKLSLDAQFFTMTLLGFSKLARPFVGQLLRSFREDSDLDMRKAANKLGTDHSFFYKIEKFDRRVEVSELCQLLRLYKRSPVEVMAELLSLLNNHYKGHLR